MNPDPAIPDPASLVYRPARPGDLEPLVRLINAGGPDGGARRRLPESLPDGYRRAFERIVTDPRQVLLVADREGQVVGTLQATLLWHLGAAGRPDCQLEAIHVAASQRGRGIGSALVCWAIAWARQHDCRRVQLTSDVRRPDAHGFYERLGFAFSHRGARLLLADGGPPAPTT